MKKRITFLLIILSRLLFAQDHKSEFVKLFQQGKEEEVLPLLQTWEKAKPDDPEMYIAFFNYYFHKSKNEIIRLADQPGQGEVLAITDTATHEPVGYMFGEIHYNDSLFGIAQQYLKEGIAKNPKRLDMYFGRIYSLREKGLLEEHVAEILKVIKLHEPGKSDWQWTDNKEIPNPEETFKGSIQDYNHALFNLEEPYTEGIERISGRMVSLYPEDVENYSNLGVCHLLRGQLPEALKLFEKARGLDPEDPLVLGNIAHTHMLMGNKPEAIRYYKKMIAFGSEDHVRFAESRIEELQND